MQLATRGLAAAGGRLLALLPVFSCALPAAVRHAQSEVVPCPERLPHQRALKEPSSRSRSYSHSLFLMSALSRSGCSIAVAAGRPTVIVVTPDFILSADGKDVLGELRRCGRDCFLLAHEFSGRRSTPAPLLIEYDPSSRGNDSKVREFEGQWGLVLAALADRGDLVVLDRATGQVIAEMVVKPTIFGWVGAAGMHSCSDTVAIVHYTTDGRWVFAARDCWHPGSPDIALPLSLDAPP